MEKTRGKILIVDDNTELLFALKTFLRPYFAEVMAEKSPNRIHEHLSKVNYDLILLDMNFKAGINSGNEGLFWMRKILERDPLSTVVLITAYGDVELAVKAMKEGAADFIQKSWDEKKILSTLIAAYKLRQSKLEIKQLKEKQKLLSNQVTGNTPLWKGSSASIQRVYDTIAKVAKTDANILLLGENGTGKEVIAKEIHRQSCRVDEVFISVDLGSLSETLFESELFGHEKGAFTDAKKSKAGRFELASGGTLFLDEIGNLPLHLQTKLLSAIQDKEITRIGSEVKISVDIRLVCATNKPLYEMVEEGTFREDLLYRINTIQVEIPPLREREEDIPGLADFFLTEYAKKYQKEGIKISKMALEKLRKHDWPGNIRELKHTIEKAVILSNQHILKPSDIEFHSKAVQGPPSNGSFNLEENERQTIGKAIKTFEGNMSLTAKELGINRSTLYQKIKKYEL